MNGINIVPLKLFETCKNLIKDKLNKNLQTYIPKYDHLESVIFRSKQ